MSNASVAAVVSGNGPLVIQYHGTPSLVVDVSCLLVNELVGPEPRKAIRHHLRLVVGWENIQPNDCLAKDENGYC